MIVLASDFGGSHITIGLVRHEQVLVHKTISVDSKRGLGPQLPLLKKGWLGLLRGCGATLGDCSGAVVAFPSLVDPVTGRILNEFGKYADAPLIDFRAWCESELGLPLAIESDARLACIGEWRSGAGQGSNDLAMITLGTGLGTAAIVEGRVVRGCHGQAGVLGGHLTVRYGGRTCSCGNIGCAEAEASTASLSEVAAELMTWNDSSLYGTMQLNYALVFQHATFGDPCAIALRDHSLLVWSALAVNLIHAYDPEVLILGGGVMGSANSILPKVRAYVRQHANTPWGRVRVRASKLGDQAALIGSEWLLKEQFPKL